MFNFSSQDRNIHASLKLIFLFFQTPVVVVRPRDADGGVFQHGPAKAGIPEPQRKK
jgi:hypothetical protein